MIISSLDNKTIKDLRKLNEKKYRDKEKKFLIEGEHLVKEAYKANLLEEVILWDFDVDYDVKKTFVSENVMKSLSNLNTPYNIIGLCKMKYEEIDYGNKILILDNVQDPGNLGTIIRSSVAFNVDTLIISDTSVDLYNSKVLRASQGMNFHINIVRRNIEKEIINLKEKKYKIYGTNVRDGIDIKNVEKNNKYAIIMGNEGSGMSKNIEKLCDKNIYVNINKKCESLNVSVAASIILYELS